jgi:B12-binding domain/radical SAM domain protein
VSTAVVFNYLYPGKYAFNVLAGALDACAATRHVPLDFPRSLDGLIAAARERRAQGHRVLVAWSFYSPGFEAAARERAAFRAQVPDPEVRCIAGGVHATAEPAQVLQAGFDLVALGEGERTVVELVRALERGASLAPIAGLGQLVDGAPRLSGRGEPVQLDDYPAFCPRHRRFGSIEVTRGCIYACKFCQTPFMNRARFRHRSVGNVCRWVRALREGGCRDVRFITPTSLSYGSQDESVCLDAVEELLARVREEMAPEQRLYYGTFPSEIRPEHVTAEAMRLLRRYVDNDNVIIGGQSGSERILAESHRGHGVEVVVAAARCALEHGFVPNVDFILGLPGEAPEDVERTLGLMERLAILGARVHGHTFMPLPGTPFRHAPPGRVEPAVQRRLEQLASRGGLYGQWKRQEQTAASLAQRPTRPGASSQYSE